MQFYFVYFYYVHSKLNMLYYVHSIDFLHSSNKNEFFVVVRTVHDTIFILSENGKYSKQEAGMSDDFNLPRRKSDIKPYRRVMASEGDSVSEMTQHCIFLVSAIVISRAFAGGVIIGRVDVNSLPGSLKTE